jgi:hypothetical protein
MVIQRWFSSVFFVRLIPNAAIRSCPTLGKESLAVDALPLFPNFFVETRCGGPPTPSPR